MLGAIISGTSSTVISILTASLSTFLGEILARISISFIGSSISIKSTNPQLLLPLTEEFMSKFFTILTPPDEVDTFSQDI